MLYHEETNFRNLYEDNIYVTKIVSCFVVETPLLCMYIWVATL